jgi:heme-degrading monooxygenase HmoA
MISRIWHGWTTPGNADRYEQLLRTEVLPEIASRGIPGYLGAHVLRKEDDENDEEVEFVTILWFESLDSVRAFMGEDYETAHVPPQARAVLSRFDDRSRHYDVLLEP